MIFNDLWTAVVASGVHVDLIRRGWEMDDIPYQASQRVYRPVSIVHHSRRVHLSSGLSIDQGLQCGLVNWQDRLIPFRIFSQVEELSVVAGGVIDKLETSFMNHSGCAPAFAAFPVQPLSFLVAYHGYSVYCIWNVNSR